MYKNTSIIMGTLLCSTTLFAGHPGDNVIAPTGVSLIAPSSQSFWTIGVEALYAQPSNANFQYAAVQTAGTTISTYDNKTVSPDYSLGGEFDVTYHFADSSRDVEVAVTHIEMDDSDDVSTQSGSQNLQEPFGVTGGILSNPNYAEGSVDNDIDAVDVVFGQTFHIGQAVTMRPFGGVRYADLESNDYAQYKNNTPTASTLLGSGRINTGLTGIGPRAGVDATFNASTRISFVGRVGMSLLIGNIDTKITTTSNSGASPINTIYDQDDSFSIAPEVDAKLGISYHQAIDQNNAFDIELGYQAVNYFNVIDNDFIDASTPNTINNTSNLGYQGPYLRLQLELV